MTKISLYPPISSPEGDDILIGTDIHHSDATKNFMIQDMFAIGLETSVSKLKIYDAVDYNYGEITLADSDFIFRDTYGVSFQFNRSALALFGVIGGHNGTIVLPSVTANRTYTLPNASGTLALQSAASGSFMSQDGKTITVTNGIITSIV